MSTQATARFRIIRGVLGSLGGTNLTSGFIVPNRDDEGPIPTGGPDFQYAESPIATQDYEGGTTAPIDFNVAMGWPMALMYPTPSQGEENTIRQLLKSGAPTAATTEITGVTTTGPVAVGSIQTVELSGGSGNLDTGVEVGDVLRVRDSSDVLLGFGEVVYVDTGAHVVNVLYHSSIPNGVNRKVRRGRRMKPGTTREYCAVEYGSTDASVYERFTDFVPSAWRFGFRNGQLGIRGSWEGAATAYAQASSAYSVTPVTETASPIFAPKTDSTIVRYAGTDLQIMDMSANIVHPLGATKLATQLAASDLVPGRISSNGSFTCFLDDNTKLAIVQAGSAAALMFAATDTLKQSLVIRWPSVKLTGAPKQREQTFISQQIGWQSQRDTSADSVGIRVFTFPT